MRYSARPLSFLNHHTRDMFPQLPSQLSTIESPVAMLRLKQCLHTLFYEQTAQEQVPFIFNDAAAFQEAEAVYEWTTPAALADRAQFAKRAEEDEIVVPPRGYTPPPTIGVIGARSSRPLTPVVNSKTQRDADHQSLLNLLLYGPSAAASSTTFPPSRNSSPNMSVATSSLHTPLHNSPAKAKNPLLKGEDDSDLFKRLEDFLDTIIVDDVVVV